MQVHIESGYLDFCVLQLEEMEKGWRQKAVGVQVEKRARGEMPYMSKKTLLEDGFRW